MRALLLLGLIVIIVPLAFFAPFTGLLSYLVFAYLRPHEWAYSASAKYSLVIAVVTLAGYLVFELPRRSPRLSSNILLLLLLAQLALSTLLAVSPEMAQEKFIETAKVILIALLVTAMAHSESRLRWLMMVTLGCIGWLTLRATAGIIIRAGNVKIFGPGGAIGDNNDYALVLDMALPMLIYFARSEKKPWLKYGFYLLAATTFITIPFTHSRGGFLGLVAVCVALALKSQHKILGMAGITVIALVMYAVVPDTIVERMSTIKDARERDASAQQRLAAWKVCLQIGADHPFFGVGIRNIMLVYGKYGEPEETRVAHNSYLQMLADAGVPAMLLFFAILGVTFWRLRRARKMLKTRAPDSALINYSHGMEVAMIGYLVSGTFVSRYDLELLYQVVAMAASLLILARSYEEEAEVQAQVAAAVPGGAEEPLAIAR